MLRRHRRERPQIEEWAEGNPHTKALLSDPRVARLRQLLAQSAPSETEVQSPVDSLWSDLARGGEYFPPGTRGSFETFAKFCWMLTDVLSQRGLLSGDDLRHRRHRACIGLAHACVNYYTDLLGRQGYRWLNGYKRAVEFRTLVSAEQPDVRALQELAVTLEAESRQEGSFFYLMLFRVRRAVETLEASEGV
jgi:hypothetical protein